ncbi:MAG: DUF4215 domain-containing protein [Myxococcota bacterium]
MRCYRVFHSAFLPILSLGLLACSGGEGDPIDAGPDRIVAPDSALDVAVDAAIEAEPDLPANVCGDGRVGGGEVCDDGNTVGGDGCAADCSSVDAGFSCPPMGGICITTILCGNGMLDESEGCDDGNVADGDGCSRFCAVEDGWACGEPGQRCGAAACGDGIVAGQEICDDANTDELDGCASDCRDIEPDYECPTAGLPCVVLNLCGNSILNLTESCDDGNAMAGDGQRTTGNTDNSPR